MTRILLFLCSIVIISAANATAFGRSHADKTFENSLGSTADPVLNPADSDKFMIWRTTFGGITNDEGERYFKYSGTGAVAVFAKNIDDNSDQYYFCSQMENSSIFSMDCLMGTEGNWEIVFAPVPGHDFKGSIYLDGMLPEIGGPFPGYPVLGINEITQWGDFKWTEMNSTFANQKNLKITASDTPDLSICSSLAGAFHDSNVTISFPAVFSSWNVSNISDLYRTFSYSNFNYDLSSWDVSNVDNMSFMFEYNSSFNQNLGNWELNQNVTLENIFYNTTGLSADNYSSTLVGWASLATIPQNKSLTASSYYRAYASSARDALVNNNGWAIQDLGLTTSPILPQQLNTPVAFSGTVTEGSSLISGGVQTIGRIAIATDPANLQGAYVATSNLSGTPISSGSNTFVPRFVNILPAENASSARATVTIFYTPADFTAYNDAIGSACSICLLPAPTANPADIQSAAPYLRIFKYAGSPAPNSAGQPSDYAGTPVELAVSSLAFNSQTQLWEVTFRTSGFSGFFLSTDASPMPVTLANLDVKKEENTVRLSWETTEQVNFSHFEIERSFTGRDFTKIGIVTARKMEADAGKVRYNFVDKEAVLVPKLYYRLRSVDLNGTFENSPIVTLRTEIAEKIYLYPTIAENEIVISGLEKLPVAVQILSSDGRLVKRAIVSRELNSVKIEHLPSGVYFVKMGESQRALKWVKK